MRRQLGLPVPREDSLPVARHPPRLLLRHEVREVPDVLSYEPALGPGAVECFERLHHQLNLHMPDYSGNTALDT